MTTVKLSAGTISKLGLEPGDVVVIQVTDERWRYLSPQQASEITQAVKEVCGDHQVVLVPYGLELQKLTLEASVS